MRAQGFTLFKLLASVFVFTTVASTGFPILYGIMQKQRLHNASYAFTTALTATRVQAVQAGRPTTLCASRDGVTCDNDNAWEKGFLIYIDFNRNGALDRNDEVVQHIGTIKGGATIRAHGSNRQLTYKPDGTLKNLERFSVCIDGEPLHGRGIKLHMAGRARVQQGAFQCPNAYGESIAASDDVTEEMALL